MIAYVVSRQNDIANIYEQKVTEDKLKNAIKIVDEAIKSELTVNEERNFIRTDKAIVAVDSILNKPRS